MELDLPVPGYGTVISHRLAKLNVQVQFDKINEPLHLVVNYTRVKVYGGRPRKTRVHGVSKRRTWRKLHLGG